MSAKGQNPLHQFPRSKSATSPQQICNKLARAKVRCVCCVVSFAKFHYNNKLQQQIGNFQSMGKLRGNVFNGCWA